MGQHLGTVRRKNRISKPALVALVATGLVATGGLAALAESVAAAPTLAVGRISGNNRYATAVDIARTTFGGSSGGTPSLPTVIMATGTNFPDALSASYLAGEKHTAILLTDPNSLPAATRAGLSSFGTRSVDLVGGPAAVGNTVVNDLTGMGITVKRIFDQDNCGASCSRYDTMESVDTLPGLTPGTSSGPKSSTGLASVAAQRTGILATGNNFPDALAAGPLAVGDHFPIILTAGGAATLSPQASTVITDEHITHLIVVGGPAAINPAQYSHLAGVTVDTAATYGANRSQTSYLLALDGVAHYGLSSSALNIANGYDPSFKGLDAQARGAGLLGPGLGTTLDLAAVSLGASPSPTPAAASAKAPDHGAPSSGGMAIGLGAATVSPSLIGFTPDALAGGVLGGTGAPLAPTLITDSPTNPGFVTRYVKAESASLTQGYVFGGTSAVSPSAMAKVLAMVPGASTYSAAALGQGPSDPGAGASAYSGPPAAGPIGQPGAAAAAAIQVALAQQGVPYVFGGSSQSGFDCSGLVMYAWAAAGVSLPHSSEAQYYGSIQIPFSDIAPGDLVFYNEKTKTNPDHVTMYIGGGQVVAADHTGTSVRVESLYADGSPMGYGQVG
ncbi:MAG: cell wall-binding repeat-containing protein [Acidimicrobiales bacterium]